MKGLRLTLYKKGNDGSENKKITEKTLSPTEKKPTKNIQIKITLYNLNLKINLKYNIILITQK